MHWVDLIWLVIPASTDPASPHVPWVETALQRGGDNRDRRHLDGLFYQSFEAKAAGSAQRPHPGRGTQARRRFMNMEDYLPQGQPTVEAKFSHQANALQVRGLVVFAAGLVAMIILVVGIIGVMMTGFSHEEAGLGALAPARFADDAGRFPAPQLQPNPDVELVEMKTARARPAQWLWMGRSQGGCRAYPD